MRLVKRIVRSGLPLFGVIITATQLFAPAAADVLVDVGFEKHPTGLYTTAMAQEDFPGANVYGLDEDEKIVDNPVGPGKVFRKQYRPRPAGVDINDFTKVQIKGVIPSLDSMYMSYDILFSPEFCEAVGEISGQNLGGKLPGLAGGRSYDPCKKAFSSSPPGGGNWAFDPADPSKAIGWSVRTFFTQTESSGCKRANKLTTFVGWIDNPHRTPSQCNKSYEVNIEFFRPFEPNKWYHIVLFVKMNTPGKYDGLQQLWVNRNATETPTANLQYAGKGFRYRTDSSLKVDEYWFVTFMGGPIGSDRVCWTYFDNFRVFASPEEDTLSPGSSGATIIGLAYCPNAPKGTTPTHRYPALLSQGQETAVRCYRPDGALMNMSGTRPTGVYVARVPGQNHHVRLQVR